MRRANCYQYRSGKHGRHSALTSPTLPSGVGPRSVDSQAPAGAPEAGEGGRAGSMLLSLVLLGSMIPYRSGVMTMFR
jgi:hypothetical protein